MNKKTRSQNSFANALNQKKLLFTETLKWLEIERLSFMANQSF